MNVSAMTALNRNLNPETIVEMYNRTIRELRAITKERDLCGYHKLRKAERVALLGNPVRPPRRPGQKKSLGKVTMLPRPEEMDAFFRGEESYSKFVRRREGKASLEGSGGRAGGEGAW